MRQRYVDLIVRPEARTIARQRIAVVRAVRTALCPTKRNDRRDLCPGSSSENAAAARGHPAPLTRRAAHPPRRARRAAPRRAVAAPTEPRRPVCM